MSVNSVVNGNYSLTGLQFNENAQQTSNDLEEHFTNEQLMYINATIQQLSNKFEEISATGKWWYTCQQDLLECAKNSLFEKAASVTFNTFKWAAYEVSNIPVSLTKWSFATAKWILDKCPGSQTCEAIRFSGRSVQKIFYENISPVEQLATNLLAPNAENIHNRALQSSIIGNHPAPEKFSVLNLIGPAMFASFCTRKCVENSNDALYHLRLLLTLKLTGIETTVYNPQTNNMRGNHPIINSTVNNYSISSLGWAVFWEGIIAAAWGSASALTSAAIYDVLKAADVQNAQLTASAIVIAAIIAPKVFRRLTDLYNGESSSELSPFGAGPSIPKPTQDAIDRLDPTGKLRSSLNPFAPTKTSSYVLLR